MAGAFDSKTMTTEDMMDKDPTLDVVGNPDEANGPIPAPFERYGQPLSKSWIPMYRKPMRTPTRRLRIACIGAGISAMNLAHKIYHERQDLACELVIYEANENIGGTWLVNTYPGVACDVPAHIYTFPFAPNPDWSAFYASGGEILEYYRKTVSDYQLNRDVKCGHRVSNAQWNEDEGKWKLKMDTKNGTVEDSAEILVSAVGFLSKWKWPDITGLHDFRGTMCHSASWDDAFDATGKRIAVLGNGSSAIQIIPQIVNQAKTLSNFIRNPTYITPGLGSGAIGGKTQYIYTAEEKANFRNNPKALNEYRKKIQAGSNRAFDMFVKNSEAQEEGKKATADQMRRKLNGNEELAARLIPDYEVGCRRATPGPGYLESFSLPHVSLITEPISKITPTGVLTTDGTNHEFDAIICATGFDVSHRPPFPLIGRNNISLSEVWRDEPSSYLSLCASGFPNFFTFAGPNAPVGHGSLMAGLGWSADYICQWARKMQEEDIKFVDVKMEVQEEFNSYSDEVMQSLAWSGGCRSWYKGNRKDGKVTAVWAGSAISYHDMIETLRPEDFEIVYRSRNRFRFMGNGRTAREYDADADLAWYLEK